MTLKSLVDRFVHQFAGKTFYFDDIHFLGYGNESENVLGLVKLIKVHLYGFDINDTLVIVRRKLDDDIYIICLTRIIKKVNKVWSERFNRFNIDNEEEF